MTKLIHITLLLAVLCLVIQSCPTLWDPWTVAHQASLTMRILQARILEWVAMCSYRGSSQTRDWTQVSHNARHSYNWGNSNLRQRRGESTGIVRQQINSKNEAGENNPFPQKKLNNLGLLTFNKTINHWIHLGRKLKNNYNSHWK